jgi:hypothetical protein
MADSLATAAHEPVVCEDPSSGGTRDSIFGTQGISLRSADVDTSSMCRNAEAIFWI